MIRFLLVVAALFSATGALAQDFPSKAITVVVPVPPGGVVDLAGRLAAEALAGELKSSVVVDNKAGASANIGATYVAQAKPDGYTLLASYSLYHEVNPLLFNNLKWRPESFVPIGRVVVTPSVVVVHPSLPVHSLKEFVEYVKKNPGAVSFASQGTGSVAHLGSELLKLDTGIEMVHVPYKGSGPAMQDLVAGRVQFFITAPPAVMGYVQQSRLRALAIAGSERHPMLPDVPTSVEQGFPNFQLNPWVGLFAPADTPDAVVRKLAAALEKGLTQPKAIESAKAAGASVSFQPPQELAKSVAQGRAYWAALIKAANIKIE